MSIIGLEFCDAGLQVAHETEAGPEFIDLGGGETGWPAVACQEGDTFRFGLEADSMWFTHPRSVSHLFIEKLSHEGSELSGKNGAALSFSQLAFYFLSDYTRRMRARADTPAKFVLAVPGRYLRNTATEEQTIGLLLGMVSELNLPLVRIIDMGCAALGGAAARELPRGSAVVHVDVHLHAAEISVYRQETQLVRRHYHHVPQTGYAPILRHLKNAMGNRFLRHTAFDIHEDRRLEQAFYQQTKDFLLGPGRLEKEFLYQINTGRRSYQMPVTRTQLAADLQGFDQTLVTHVTSVAHDQGISPSHCVVSLTDRAARLDGLEAKLRSAGFNRILRLRPGAAAMGAAALGADWPTVSDLCDVPVEASVPLTFASAHELPVEANLIRPSSLDGRPAPSHVIIDGIGRAIGENGLLIGTRHTHSQVDASLPEPFDAVGDYAVRISRDGPRIRLELPSGGTALAPVDLVAGDRLCLIGAGQTAEILLAACPSSVNGHQGA
ncbi:hypothetical protein MASR2M8_00750 [Opitutaceae bacterium]